MQAQSLAPQPNKRRHKKQRIDSASPMEGLSPTIGSLGKRASALTPCAVTCHNAAGAAVCPDLATTCQCTNANFQFDFLSCVQGECQAGELGSAQQFLTGLCGTTSPNSKPTATTPFLPTNPKADIDELQTSTAGASSSGGTPGENSSTSTTTQTTSSLSSSQTVAPSVILAHSSTEGISTTISDQTVSSSAVLSHSSTQGISTATSNQPVSSSAVLAHSSTGGLSTTTANMGSPTQTSQTGLHRNGAPAGAVAASVMIGILIVALVVFVFWIRRRRRQRIRERRFPEQFLEPRSPAERLVRNLSIIKVPVATDVETQAEVTQAYNMAQGEPEKGGPARASNLRLMTFSAVAAEDASPVSDAQNDARHEETMPERLLRVEAQLAALLAVGSRESSPPSYYHG
ncbi:hypothetical protein C8R45DRAFT_1014514 [Mycena sanguinolenta]|nr:hypothetical protein C8R45DRAFT_1014514 [Mycena sanguinolenta]